MKWGMGVKKYNAAVYARLSVKGIEKKAQSIKNQVLICTEFIGKNKDICFIESYCDYGKSGMNFDRPEFKRMYSDIRMGKINCVVVKDLSRFGRNHIDTGEYLQKIFPLSGVRFISVCDGYDSLYDLDGRKEFAVNLKNLVNELYASDISVKVKYAKEIRRREGNYLGSVPPYGWKIEYENDIRILTEDKKTSHIVSFIKKQYENGKSVKEIVEILFNKKINSPAQYIKSGIVVDDNAKRWCESAVRNVLKRKD